MVKVKEKALLSVMIWVVIVSFGLIYATHINLGNVGVVVQTMNLTIEQIPREIQPYLRFLGNPVFLLLKQPVPVDLQIPEAETLFVVITGRSFPIGATVEVVNPALDWRVDSRDFPFVLQFQRLLISDTVRNVSAFEAAVEQVLFPPLGSLVWYATVLCFYGGPALLILESFVFDRRPTFTSFLLTASAYSLLDFFRVVSAGAHYNYLSSGLRYFGYIFPAFFIAAYLMWRFERSPSGVHVRQKLWGL